MLGNLIAWRIVQKSIHRQFGLGVAILGALHEHVNDFHSQRREENRRAR
jgi:hypothetical protein